MKPAALDYLETARRDLHDARQIVQINLFKVAARSAYYAAFHAAEALIFERTGRSVKTHRGVRIEFVRLTNGLVPPTQDMADFLAKSYRYKELSDYSTDRTRTVSEADARDLIERGSDFVRWEENLLE